MSKFKQFSGNKRLNNLKTMPQVIKELKVNETINSLNLINQK